MSVACCAERRKLGITVGLSHFSSWPQLGQSVWSRENERFFASLTKSSGVRSRSQSAQNGARRWRGFMIQRT